METKVRIVLVATVYLVLLVLSILSKYVFEQVFLLILSAGIGLIIFALFVRNDPLIHIRAVRIDALYRFTFMFLTLHIIVAVYSGDILPASSLYDDSLAIIQSPVFFPSKIFSSAVLVVAANYSLTVGFLVTHLVSRDRFISQLIGLICLIFGMLFGFFLSVLLLNNIWFINLITSSLMVSWLAFKQSVEISGESTIVIGY